jgi:hypothetical protein
MDVAGLSKLSAQGLSRPYFLCADNRSAILNLVMVLGFLAHGYATQEFEVTEERLGVYLPVEVSFHRQVFIQLTLRSTWTTPKATLLTCPAATLERSTLSCGLPYRTSRWRSTSAPA